MSLSTASVSLFTLVYRLCRLSVGDCVSVLSTVKRLGVSFTFHRLFILLRISKNKEMINVCKKRLTVNQEIGKNTTQKLVMQYLIIIKKSKVSKNYKLDNNKTHCRNY